MFHKDKKTFVFMKHLLWNFRNCIFLINYLKAFQTDSVESD